jgi:Pretoxin HINT domain
MFYTLLIFGACLAAEPAARSSEESQTKAHALAAYQQAKVTVGRDANAHVRLALWCERNGLPSERLKHLTIAVLTDPAHARARGLLGLVSFRGQWHLPEEIRDTLRADEATSGSLAEYRARRARLGDSADAHRKLAIWCREHGLTPEATAHLTVVTQLDPGRESAWKRLGYKKHGSRWLTATELAERIAESQARTKADRHWTTLLDRWRSWLEVESRRPEAAKALQEVTDPNAVRAIWAIFASGKTSQQRLAVQLLGQIDSPDSTRALATLAIASESGEVRGRSIETLRRRDPRAIASFLVGQLRDLERDRDPILYRFLLQPIGWNAIGSLGYLFIRGPLYDIFRTYTVDESFKVLPSGEAPITTDVPDYVNRIMSQRRRQVADLFAIVSQILSEFEGKIPVPASRFADQMTVERNTRIIDVLSKINGRYLGKDPEVWRKWWADERGYTYESPAPRTRPDLTRSADKPTFTGTVHLSCFAAGTPVHTLSGLRPIESVRIGDLVLTQDPHTAELSYQPVIAAVQNNPDRLVEIDLGKEVVRATGIHRFWKAGQGWVPARDLKPGESLRALGGVAVVKGVRRGRLEPVFNLKVMHAQSFFVGQQGALVHDNSAVEPVLQPFDLVAGLAGDQ